MSATGRIEDYDARVEEFGIACEACHGPAGRHVTLNQDPKRRYLQHVLGARDPTIVDPADLTGLRASQVCGQCHGITGEKISRSYPMREFLSQGRRYRPGDDLAETHFIVRHTDPAMRAMMPRISRDETYWQKSFWSDGMIRVSGREYNGLVESPCARSEKFTCMACHSMHPRAGDLRPLPVWADDQLDLGMDGDRACTTCHEHYGTSERAVKHTHHAATSEGSRCLNCHMPYSTWGLLKATRSHLVSSPTVKESLEVGRPNACNQCHLDRTLAFTAEYLEAWYGQARPELSEEQASVAASLLWLLKGDGGQRALMAWSLGWPAAWAASGRDWLAPHLAALLDDPYDAVRLVAGRSLRRLPGFEDFDYDFAAPAAELTRAGVRAARAWHEPRRGRAGRGWNGRTGRAILIESDGTLRQDLASQLVRQRDDRPVRLQE